MSARCFFFLSFGSIPPPLFFLAQQLVFLLIKWHRELPLIESTGAWADMRTLRVVLMPPLPLGSSVAARAKAGRVSLPFSPTPRTGIEVLVLCQQKRCLDRVTAFAILWAVSFYVRMFSLSLYWKPWLCLSKKQSNSFQLLCFGTCSSQSLIFSLQALFTPLGCFRVEQAPDLAVPLLVKPAGSGLGTLSWHNHF